VRTKDVDVDENLNDLAAKFGSDKGRCPGDWGIAHEYTDVYAAFLGPRRLEPLRILELGVWKGASLQIWETFFPNAQVIGVENLPDIVTAPFRRAKVKVGDATDSGFLNEVLAQFRDDKVDIIIDDASHVLEQQIASFETLFPALDDGGLYFVEDISGSRYKDGNHGTLPFRDFLDYAWCLAQQATFFPHDAIGVYHTIKDVRSLSGDERAALAFSYWNENLYGVSFFHDLCVFQKRRREVAADIQAKLSMLRPRCGLGFKAASLAPRHTLNEEQVITRDDISWSRDAILERSRDLRDEIDTFLGPIPMSEIPRFVIMLHHRKVRVLLERIEAALQHAAHSEAQVKTLIPKVNSVESERVRISAELSQKCSENHALSAQIKTLTHDLEELNSRAAEARVRQEEIPMLHIELERERRRAFETEEKLERSEKATAELRTEQDSLRRQVEELQSQLHREQCKSERIHLSEREDSLERLSEVEQQCRGLEEELAAQRDYASRTLSKAWQVIFNLQAEHQADRAEVSLLREQEERDAKARDELRSQFLQSTSWRLTAPLRALRTYFLSKR
jgi:hypothetical protein